jgi:peptide-methionine (R)-S-oxide reductase
MPDYHKNPATVDTLRPDQYYVTQESRTERPSSAESLVVRRAPRLR